MLTAFLAFEILVPLVYCKTAEDASNSLLSYANHMINAPIVFLNRFKKKKDIGKNIIPISNLII